MPLRLAPRARCVLAAVPTPDLPIGAPAARPTASSRSGLAARPAAARRAVAGVIALALFAGPYTATAADDKPAASAAAKSGAGASAPKPALTVTVSRPQTASLDVRIVANGNIAAWQEASVGTEANGLRLAEVRVNVGDVVKRGQVLATFAPDTLNADVAQIRASVAEAEATLADAQANAQRARELQTSGALSGQQINQYLTAERTAQARLDAQKAAARVQQLRLRQSRVLAPDDGVISARSATVGAVLPAGQELFRMIRKGRLEWRAEVPAAELARILPGQLARIDVGRAAVGGVDAASAIEGRVRIVAPTVDPQTRNGLVYVDLPIEPAGAGAARAGMFARGEFALGSGDGLTLPQSAVLLRDGFSYVLRVGADSKVTQTKVAVGRRAGDRIEVTGGLPADARVVTSGGAFLADGDTVRVVEAPPPRPVVLKPTP